jgi:hypothetical protein
MIFSKLTRAGRVCFQEIGGNVAVVEGLALGSDEAVIKR